LFEASLDGGAYATVTATFTLSNLAEGAHTVNVRARDAAGNIDATPASFSWQVDTLQPSAQIVFPTAVSYTDASQLHVRGTASDAHTITSVTVNGVAATTTDAFAHWSALVPTAAAVNNLAVSVSDNFGNSNASAATVQVANRGTALHDLRSIAFDAAHGRVLAADLELNAIVALRASDGHASIFSDATHGTGPSLGGFFVLTVDAPNNRAISMNRGTNELLAIDLTTGDRTVIPTAAPTSDTSYLYGIACNSPCTRIYTFSFVPGDPAVFSIDLTTGVRSIISGSQFHLGNGRSLVVPTDIVLDTSTSTPRLLVSDSGLDAVFAVDLANGNRTVMSSANATLGAVGTGAAFGSPNGVAIDLAHNRLLVADNVTGGPNRLIAVDLTNGNRTVLPIAGTISNYHQTFSPVLDSANARLFVAAFPHSNVVQVNLNSNEQTRFADSQVGTGPELAGGSILLDTSTPSRSLITTANGAVVRVDLATGIRSAIAAINYPNGGAPFTPQYLQYDTRPGVPANRFLYADQSSNPSKLYSLDLTTGVSTALSSANIPYSPHPELPLDGPNGRLLINVEPTFGRSQILPVDVATGLIGPAIADSSVGTPSFGPLSALAFENAPGVPRRLIAMDNQSILFAFDLATGNRTVVSSNAGVGSGPWLTYANAFAINPATRRALAVSGGNHAIQEVDLLTGNRITVSGGNLADSSIRGTGPWITPPWCRIAADFGSQVAYVTSNSESILTVDLVSGDRVLTAR
jgi:hypothetical protein